MTQSPNNQGEDFSSLTDRSRPGLVGELADFLLHNKKWWLAPIIIVLLAMGGLIILGGTAAAPLIYTLF